MINKNFKEKGYTLVPLQVYFKSGKVKVEIALGKPKKNYDKRDVIKKRDDERMISSIKKSNGRDIY